LILDFILCYRYFNVLSAAALPETASALTRYLLYFSFPNVDAGRFSEYDALPFPNRIEEKDDEDS
jgi:hypothetical protein